LAAASIIEKSSGRDARAPSEKRIRRLAGIEIVITADKYDIANVIAYHVELFRDNPNRPKAEIWRISSEA
jgi:hypothetical protein